MNPDNLPVSPLENASFLSKIFFCWLLNFFRLGSKRDLQLSDLYRVSQKNKSEKLGNDLEHAWKDEVRKANEWNSIHTDKKPKSPSLGKALVKVFLCEYTVFGFFTLFEDCVIKIGQPILLGLIIRYCAGEFEDLYGYSFGAGLFIFSVLYTLQHQPYFFLMLQIGMKVRVACSSLLYRKALKLSQAAVGKTNVGQLVNLLSNDVKRFDQSVTLLHYLWVGPIQLSIVTYILWGYYGWPCLVGVAVFLLFVPFQGIMGKLFGMLRLKIAERTDRRIRIMSEIINSVRIIKMYAWELPFANLIGEARKEEVKCIRKTAFLHAVNNSWYDISTKVVTFVTLLTYVLAGNHLSAEKVFVAMSLYNNVRKTITLNIPLGISQLAESLVSIKRLENFLLLEERNIAPHEMQVELTESNDHSASSDSKEEGEIFMTNVNARWSTSNNSDINVNTLTDISLKVTKGHLVAVIGSVGSGKTSLLQVLLHELPFSSGGLEIKGKLAYTCQEPWIFSGSVRDNILFGRDYEYDRYHHTIQAWALYKDLELFPSQDQTLVGDRGTSLSGGQKARINLARAVYANADIYLLDDPLSAVDAEVAKHIFEKCIMGLLKEKAVILVTHQLQFLKPAEEIILLSKGKVQARGSYDELLKMPDINFAQTLQTDAQSTPKHISSLSKTESELESSLEHEDIEDCADAITVKSYGLQNNKSKKVSKSLLARRKSRRDTYSTTSTESTSSDASEESRPLLPQRHEETRSQNKVGLKLYWRYISAGASWFGLLCLLVTNIIVQLLFSGSDYWLQYWTKVEQNRTITDGDLQPENFSNVEYSMFSHSENETNKDYSVAESIRNVQVYIYLTLIMSLLIFSVIKNSIFFHICLNSSIELHRKLFKGVMRAPMRFFEINPSGRVLNRFAKDIGIIDEMLPQTLSDTIEVALHVIGVVTIICVNNPYLMLPSLSLPIIFYFVREFYLKTSKCVQHLEAMAKSPVFSHLSTSLYGLSTIRAMKAEDKFERQFDAHQDLHTASCVLFMGTARWLGIVVEWSCVVYIGLVTFTFLMMKGGDSGPAIGLSIASAMSLTGMFQWGVRQSAETENQMVCVERVQDYAEIEPEGELDSSLGTKPPSDWPSKGEISFKYLSMRYGSDQPVLKNITCFIKSQEKVGIVGRTGSGKSSLLTALFRITEPCQGDIEIDGISILRLGLHDLRRKISIIPQDPVLFNNTLRRNLDPFEDYTDEELWNVLEQVYLADMVKEIPAGLDTEIAEGGSNFSVGQRQLICLGRAILRKNKILVLDEATANVDNETDALIQKTIREKFAACTVLTIAHRLHTVMDSDRILILDEGEIKEFDEPYNLLCNKEGVLSQLVATTGKRTAASLYKLAKEMKEK